MHVPEDNLIHDIPWKMEKGSKKYLYEKNKRQDISIWYPTAFSNAEYFFNTAKGKKM